MRMQFSLRWLIAFVLWMGLALMLNFHVMKQYARIGGDRIYLYFGRGWPIEFQSESSRRYELIPIDEFSSRFDIGSPIEVVPAEPNFPMVFFILNMVFWIILFTILRFGVAKLLSLQKLRS